MSTKSERHIDLVDRVTCSWIVNFILNLKTQEEIAKDIADGILDFKEVEEMFPWRYVEKLRQGSNLESTLNFLNRFAQISEDRLKMILDHYLRQKSRNDIIKLIQDNALKLDKLKVSYLWKYIMEKDENIDSEPSTSSSFKNPNEEIIAERKESSNVEKKSKEMMKKGDNSETSSIIVLRNPSNEQILIEKKGSPSVGVKRKQMTTKSDNSETSSSSLLISPDEQIFDESKELSNVETKRKRIMKKDDNSEPSSSSLLIISDKQIVDEMKESPSVKTKKEQMAKKGNKKETKKETKKGEKKETKKSDKEETKKSDKEETEKKVEKVKKVRIARKKMTGDKLKDVKAAAGNVDNGNKVEEAIEKNISVEGNHGNVEKASTEPGVSTGEGSHQKGLEELSVACQEDSSKYVESTIDAEKKIIKKLDKEDIKASTEKINERVSKEMNFPIDSTSSKNEKERVETRNNDGSEESSQKSRSNENVNVSSLIKEKQEFSCNQESRNVQEYDLNIQLDSSTPKKLDNDDDKIQIKKEPKEESLLHVIYYPIDKYKDKDVDPEKKLNKQLQVINDEEVSNSTDSVKSVIVKPRKITKFPEIGEPGPATEKAKETVKKSKCKKHADKSLEQQRKHKCKQIKKKEIMKREIKIRNTLEQLKGQIDRLIKDIKYLGENESSSSSIDDNSEKDSLSSSYNYISGGEASSSDYDCSYEESLYSLFSSDSEKSFENCSYISPMSSQSESSESTTDTEYTICTSSNQNDSTNNYTSYDF
ncbi:myosin-2 heavy chain-like isoform X2 [Vespa mandarinia]|uniref:myosin-2 heavy chain-like isoform X2 n=1 Tax=Vespa mandarinia TaxID=7446 RepID=UPI00161CFA5A|nr:myosin-2 heavy chain-like isoform X2 [Vespa mandarinia]